MKSLLSEDLTVIDECESPNVATCQNWDVRIVSSNSGTNNTGRLDICIRENWNTICNIGLEMADANVACRQAGFSRFGKNWYNANSDIKIVRLMKRINDAIFNCFAGATVSTVSVASAIYQFSFACTGNETTLRGCARSSQVGCSGSQVTCSACKLDQIIKKTRG